MTNRQSLSNIPLRAALLQDVGSPGPADANACSSVALVELVSDAFAVVPPRAAATDALGNVGGT